MQVLQICPKPPLPPKDGGCIAMNSLSESLIENGVQLDILAIETKKHPYHTNEIDDGYVAKKCIATAFVDTEIKSLNAFLNLFSSKSYNVKRFESKVFSELIASQLASKEYDFVLLESIYVMPFIDVIRSVYTGKVGLRLHNLEFEIWDRLSEQSNAGLKKEYLRLLSRRLHRFEMSAWLKVDALYPISSRDLIALQELGINSNIEYLPFGLKATKATFSGRTIPKLGFVGSMAWEPNKNGYSWFIDYVWNHILDQIPEAEITMAGRDYPDWLKDTDGINYIGEVENATNFINDLDVLIVPLMAGSGIRIKILEAMQSGKVVITTPVGAEGINYKDHNALIVCDDADSFERAILNLYQAWNEHKNIGRNAAKYINTYHNKADIGKQLINSITRR